MTVRCCVKSCAGLASIRQPLKLGNHPVLHVPLCEKHSNVWMGFANRLSKSKQKAVQGRRDATWLLDSAHALALFPPGEQVQ